MTDLVVTVPRDRWAEWLAEGALAGEPAAGEHVFAVRPGDTPPIAPGDRVYVVAWDRLRGYAPLVRLEGSGAKGWALIRSGGAVAVTTQEQIRGFGGWRVRWWRREEEVAFPGWQTEGVPAARPTPVPAPPASPVPAPRPAAPRAAPAPIRSRGAAPGGRGYAQVVGLQVKKGELLKPEEFEQQHAAALAEIAATGALSFVGLNDRGQQTKDVFVIRCGTKLDRGQFCLLPRDHRGVACSPVWPQPRIA